MKKIPIPPPPKGKVNIPPPPKSIPPVPKKEEFLDIRKKTTLDQEVGKIPPSAIDMEIAVLGALMSFNSSLEVMDILESDVFFKEEHRTIFRSIKSLFDERQAIDIFTVAQHLESKKQLNIIGGNAYLIDVAQSVVSSAHIEFHARIVLQKYILRELIRLGGHLVNDAYGSDPDSIKLINQMEINMRKIREIAIREVGYENHSQDAEDELMEKMRRVQAGEKSGLEFSIREFDEWCGGLQRRELATVAARPGQGKTTLGISVAWNSANIHKEKTAFFSLEMSSIDVKNRIASGITHVNYSDINRGMIDPMQWSLVKEAYKTINESCLEIIDTRMHKNTHENIVDKIRELAAQGFQFFLIDYVQLMSLTNATANETSDLKKITRELKALAVELNILIVQFAQLDRRVDDRPSKMPYLRDLKQSGSLEEDSDTVIFLVRLAYYKIIETPGLKLPESEIGKTDFIIAKGRNIGLNSFKVFLDFLNYNALSYCDKYF